MRRRTLILAATSLAAPFLPIRNALAEETTAMPELITHDVAVTRTFNASPARAWAAWTEDAQVMKWWGPKPWTCPEARMDVREGGASIRLHEVA